MRPPAKNRFKAAIARRFAAFDNTYGWPIAIGGGVVAAIAAVGVTRWIGIW